MTAENLTVNLGRFDLRDSGEESSVDREVKNIIIHPEWKKSGFNYHADIAMIVLKDEISYSDYIQPICLPLSNSKGIVDEGKIVGWGKSEATFLTNDEHENTPKQADITAINNELCFLDQPELAKLSSVNTFCAGGKNYGACSGILFCRIKLKQIKHFFAGDSGGGFYVLSGEKNYVIRGIISASLINSQRRCNVETFSIYTDVSSFLNWIENRVNETSNFKRNNYSN